MDLGLNRHEKGETKRLMGSKRSNWYMIIILVTFSLYLLSSIQCNNSFNPNSLDTLVHDYASQTLMRSRTGSLYRVPLPANFSAMEVSVVRLISGSFWTRGVNYSSFSIPPPSPFVQKLAIVYQDLGNLSSSYYHVPGYKLDSHVVGFFAYDASNLIGWVGVMIYKWMRRKNIEEMGRESEKGVSFDTIWVGRSKLPCASMIRTQPSLEN